MAEDLTKAEQGHIEDLDYLLRGHRKNISATLIIADPQWFASETSRIEAEIAKWQEKLATLRHTHENAESIVRHEQREVQRLLKLIKHRQHRAEIEKLLELHAKLNQAGVTERDLDALREQFGMTDDSEEEGTES